VFRHGMPIRGPVPTPIDTRGQQRRRAAGNSPIALGASRRSGLRVRRLGERGLTASGIRRLAVGK
jgi:hypothetical protein